MPFVGNLPESSAAHYKDARYTHSTWVNGREVRHYDCFRHDTPANPFADDDADLTSDPKVQRILELDRYRNKAADFTLYDPLDE